jgi:putative aminopeptidase FrvX
MIQRFELLKELSECPGIPGREERVRGIVARELQGFGYELSTDLLGNLIAFRPAGRAGAKRLMLAAHMDEIGFIVSYIDDRGFARLQPVGGFDTRVLMARRIDVHTKTGVVPGLLQAMGKGLHGSTAEERRTPRDTTDLFVDFGLPARRVKMLVSIGDMVTLSAPCTELGECITGKCLDNRVQVFNLVMALRRLKKSPFDIHGVFTVQEEVGLRGASVSGFGVQPEIAIGLDTTVANDVLGNTPDSFVTRLGAGVGIKVMDSQLISDRGLVDHCVTLCERGGIDFQLEVLPRGANDAGVIQRSRAGVRAMTLSVPTRYLHSVTETVQSTDVTAAQELLVRLVSEPLESGEKAGSRSRRESSRSNRTRVVKKAVARRR